MVLGINLHTPYTHIHVAFKAVGRGVNVSRSKVTVKRA
jgi:hypothetical protein